MVAGLVRKVQLLEEESVRVNERLRDVLTRLEQCEKEYEEHEKVRKTLEMKAIEEDEQIEIQEAQVAEAIMLAEEGDRKFEEMSRKLRMVENDYERMVDKAEDLEKKFSDWETDI